MDTKNFCSVDSKLLVIASNTARLTLAALTNRRIVSYRKLSTLCFSGIARRQYAMCISQMFSQKIKQTCL
jgi:hypothetical protein